MGVDMRRRGAVASLCVVVAVCALTVPAQGAPAGCTITGTAGDDHLKGTEADDVICGLGGDDELSGAGGNDVLFGGDGNDVLRGGDGDDRLQGGPGTDSVSYEFSPAAIVASLRRGTATGDGTDALQYVEILIGSPQGDVFEGSADPDELLGGSGDDELTGGGGADTLEGQAGDDRVDGTIGDDVEDGGWGADVVEGGYGGDHLVGDEGADRLAGGSGPDQLEGQEGSDRLDGGTGTDGCVQGLDDGKKLACEVQAYADADGLALFIPSRAPIGFAYHESLFSSAVDLRPYGHLEANDNPGKFRPPPETADGPDYVVMDTRRRRPGATTATDIVLPSRSQVLAPLNATVVSVDRYLLYCKTPDWKVVLRPKEEPGFRVLLLHMATPLVHQGDDVRTAVTVLGITAENDASDAQENRYFPDRYPHVHIEVERGGASPTPGCEL